MLGSTSQITFMKFLLLRIRKMQKTLGSGQGYVQKLHMFNWLQQKYLQLSQSETIMSQQMAQQLKLCK